MFLNKRVLLFSTIIFLLLLSFVPTTYAKPLTFDEIKLLAVTPDGIGTEATLSVTLTKGVGKVWSSVESLVGTSTQNTERIAVDLLQKYFKDSNSYDYYFDIKSNAKTVDGPSAGLPTALVLYNLFAGKETPDYVSGTGTISSSGNIGKVGGVLEKTKYASKVGIKLFFVPKSELDVIVKDGDEVKRVDLSSYAESEWGIKVIGVDKLDDVLKYNLADVNAIKTPENTKKEDLIYDPPATTFEQNLQGFYNYIAQYEKETNANILYTENLLMNSGVEIDDSDLLTELYAILTDTKDIYKDGVSAYDKNYLYSSANQFYLANVYANLVKDLLQNPALVDNSSELNKYLTELESKIPSLEDFDVPCDGYEWYIAGKQRLLWANNKISDIKKIKENDKSSNILGVMSYEEAKEWVKISELFSSYVQEQNCFLDNKPYKENAEQLLWEISKASTITDALDIAEADKWVNGAKDANANGWYLVSIFDSASALAIFNSSLETQNKDTNYIEQKTIELLDSLKESKKDFIWVNLYLQHANYYFNAHKFYKTSGKEDDALASLKSAYELGLFAKNLLQVTEDVENNKDAISYYKDKTTGTNKTDIFAKVKSFDIYKGLILIFILVVGILLIVLVIFYHKLKEKNKLEEYLGFVDYRIYKIKTFILQTEKDYYAKKITEEIYKDLTDKYNAELQLLFEEKQEVQKSINEIKFLEFSIGEKHAKIIDLKNQFAKNKISHEEYVSNLQKYTDEEMLLERKIAEDYDIVAKSVVDGSAKKQKTKTEHKKKRVRADD